MSCKPRVQEHSFHLCWYLERAHLAVDEDNTLTEMQVATGSKCLGGIAAVEAVVCLTQACDELCRADLILCKELNWSYYVDNLLKNRNIRCVEGRN